ncbi:MAG TPA: AAA family ATPase [Gemmataceae bacterium]|nr:AAA family ATPase [Gemmataceae bacterium]
MKPISEQPSPSSEALVPAAANGRNLTAGPDPILPPGPPDELVARTDSGIEYTPAKVLRALRRRWAAALGLAVLGAIIAGFAADQLISSTYTVRTQVYIPADRPGVPYDKDGRGDVTNYQRRQSALVRNRRVLHAALERPGVSDLSMFRDSTDPAGSLERDLLVDFGASPEIMRVSLRGDSPDEQIVVLNAIREAYLKEGANRDVTEKSATLAWLRQLLAEDQGKLDAARAAVTEKAGTLNAPDAATVRLRYQNSLTQLANLRTLRFQLDVQQKSLMQARTELLANPPDPAAPPAVRPADLKAATELALSRDAAVAMTRSTISRLEAEVAEYKRLLVPGSVNRALDAIERELKDATAALAVREQEVRAKVVREQDEEARRGSDFRAEEYRIRVRDLKVQADGLTAQIGSLDAEIKRLDADALAEAKAITELDRLTVRAGEVEDRVKATKHRAEVIEMELGVESPLRAQTHEEAVITQVPNPMRKVRFVVGAIVVGFLTGLLGVAFLDMRAGRIDSPDGVHRRLHAGVVGCIPRAPAAALAALTRPSGSPPGPDEAALCDAADACRTLLLNALAGDTGPKVVMVTSAVAGEGKTSLAAQLALSLGRAGYPTLLIDGDVRQPGAHSLFGRSQSPGLTDVLRKTHPFEQVVRKTPLANVGLIPAGQCHPHEAVALLQLRLGSLLRKCKPHFRVILIDTPPLLDLPDAMVIGRHADGTILSLMNEVSTMPAAQAACARLRTLNIPLLGAVLNGARVHSPVGY